VDAPASQKEHPRNLTHTRTYVYLGINKGLAEGALTPYAGIQFALADAPASHLEVIQHSQGTKGKIILKIRDGEGKMELWIYEYQYVYIYVYVSMYMYMYMYTYTHIYTCIHLEVI